MTAESTLLARPASSGSVQAELFRQGMRSLFSGVCIVSTALGGERVGLVASSVTSVSMDPPTLLVCVNRSASAHDKIKSAGVFAVSILAENHAEIARIFSNSKRRNERFAAGLWKAAPTGCPVLGDAPASFDCRTVQMIDGGTHTVFIGLVLNVQLQAEPPPLLYGYGNFGAYVPRTVFPTTRDRLTIKSGASFEVTIYKNSSDQTEHFALSKGDISNGAPVLTRLQAVNLLQDVIMDDHEGRGGIFQLALDMIEKEGRGLAILLYELSPYPSERLRARRDGAARSLDLLEFGVCSQIIRDLDVKEMELIGNRDDTTAEILRGFGFRVKGWRPVAQRMTP